MKLPFKLTLWRLIAGAIGVFIFIGVIVLSLNWFQSRGYDKARKQYEAESKAWATERTAILTRAEEAEKRAAALEPKAIAFEALAAQHKAADAGLVKKIEEVSQNAANKEAKALEPTDCAARARDVCNLLTANKIRHDCSAITRENCGQ